MPQKIEVEVYEVSEKLPLITQNTRSVLAWQVGEKQAKEVFYNGAGRFFYVNPYSHEKVYLSVERWCELPKL